MRANWPRFVLILLAASVLFYAQEQEMRLVNAESPFLAVEMIVFGGVSFSFLLLALSSRLPDWTNQYVLCAGLLVFGLYILTQTLMQGYGVDTLAAGQYGAELLLRGKHPYVDFDQVDMLRRFNLPDSMATTMMDGSIEHHLTYPSGSFLFILPFVAAGVSDTRIVYILLLLAMVLVMHYYAEAALKNVVVLALLSNVVVIRFAAGGLPEPLWALPLLLAWMWRDGRWRSAIAFGIAASIKQLAWFFAPFYLIMTLKEYGIREAFRRAGIGIVIFAVLNVPFAVPDPALWFQSVLGPMIDPLVPMGGGLVALGISHVLPLWSPLVYDALSVLVLIVCLTWYYRHYETAPEAAMVLATLPLWFAWRSLLSYFYLGGLLMFGVILAERQRASTVQPGTRAVGISIDEAIMDPSLDERVPEIGVGHQSVSSLERAQQAVGAGGRSELGEGIAH